MFFLENSVGKKIVDNISKKCLSLLQVFLLFFPVMSSFARPHVAHAIFSYHSSCPLPRFLKMMSPCKFSRVRKFLSTMCSIRSFPKASASCPSFSTIFCVEHVFTETTCGNTTDYSCYRLSCFKVFLKNQKKTRCFLEEGGIYNEHFLDLLYYFCSIS